MLLHAQQRKAEGHTLRCVSPRSCPPAVENIDEQIAELEGRLSGSSINLSGGGLVGEERQRVERQLAALQRSRRCEADERTAGCTGLGCVQLHCHGHVLLELRPR